MKRIAVLTSGGDAPGMNAAVRAVVRKALNLDMSVVGFKRGYNGTLMRNPDAQKDYEILTASSVSNRIHRGGTFLYTARCKEFLKEEYQQLAIKNMKMIGVEGLVCIGGDGTFKGAEALNRLGLPTVGVPATIDNDLRYTDYTIGFDTAVNTACECINRIRETGDSHERASMITVMGRACGDLALHTALSSGAELYMVPEIPWDVVEIAERVRWGVMRGKRSMILVFAEGAMSSLTTDLTALIAENPALSDINLNDVGSHEIARIIEVLSGHETRATVLGYLQRGGSPSARDRILGTTLGAHAVELLNKNISGVAVGVLGNKSIKVPYADVQKDLNETTEEMANLIDVMAVMTHR